MEAAKAKKGSCSLIQAVFEDVVEVEMFEI